MITPIITDDNRFVSEFLFSFKEHTILDLIQEMNNNFKYVSESRINCLDSNEINSIYIKTFIMFK
jgi:hypothetical protein